jgi:hypothetical protein
MLPRLFKECVESLSNNVTILSQKESNNIFEYFEKCVPIVSWGRVDWKKVDKKAFVDAADQIIDAIEKLAGKPLDTSVYVLWNDDSIPVVKSDLLSLAHHIEDVTCVAPDTWFLNITSGYIIESFHEEDGFFIGLF